MEGPAGSFVFVLGSVLALFFCSKEGLEELFQQPVEQPAGGFGRAILIVSNGPYAPFPL
jgi:hypothetical protein